MTNFKQLLSIFLSCMCTSAVYGMEHEIKMPPPLEHELIKQQLIAAGFKEDHPAIKNLTAEKPASSEINASELTEAQKTDIKELTKYGYHPYAAHVIATQADSDKKISVEDAIRNSNSFDFKTYDPDQAPTELQAPVKSKAPTLDESQTDEAKAAIGESTPKTSTTQIVGGVPVLSRPAALEGVKEETIKQNVLDEDRKAYEKKVAAEVAAKEEEQKAATRSPAGKALHAVQTACHSAARGIGQLTTKLRELMKKLFPKTISEKFFENLEGVGKSAATFDEAASEITAEGPSKKMAVGETDVTEDDKAASKAEKIHNLITSLNRKIDALRESFNKVIPINSATKAARAQFNKIITQMRKHTASADDATKKAKDSVTQTPAPQAPAATQELLAIQTPVAAQTSAATQTSELTE